MKRLVLILTLLASVTAAAATKSLEKELKDLDMQDAVPSPRVSERMYAVQMRANPLSQKWEVLMSAGQVVSGSSFLNSRQFGAEGKYHFNDRWSVAGAYSQVQNKFNSSAENLLQTTGYLPDVDYAKSRLEARLHANLFYGKIRFTRTQAISFDQYVGVGAALNELRSGTSTGPVADLGFAFYLGKRATFHLGVKDYYYNESRTLSKGNTHNVQAYAQAGALF